MDDIRALSLQQQRAWLAGVLHGDGWCTRQTIGLRVKDRDFADTFAATLNALFGLDKKARQDERGYWLVRVGNKRGTFDGLRSYAPADDGEVGAWLRGLFDSEGNANLVRLCRWPNSWGRRVALYSTSEETLATAACLLARMGIVAYQRSHQHGVGHRGSKPVFALHVCGGQQNYERFARAVGSSIARKQSTLDALAASYCQDRSGACRAAQQLGAATRARRTQEQTIPTVVAAIRDLLDRGEKPTMGRCQAEIPGYHTARNHLRHSELLSLAQGGVSSKA